MLDCHRINSLESNLRDFSRKNPSGEANMGCCQKDRATPLSALTQCHTVPQAFWVLREILGYPKVAGRKGTPEEALVAPKLRLRKGSQAF